MAEEFTVVYVSNFHNCEVEVIKIGEFNSDRKAIIESLNWLFINEEGGFDADFINADLLEKSNKGYDDRYTGYLERAQLVKYLSRGCDVWSDFQNICKNYGNSRFRKLNDGWNIIKLEN